MPFVKVQCTSCGGDIQLDDQKVSGFCLHCGTKVVFKEAQKQSRPPTENLFNLAESAYEDGNYQEAINNFNRVLEFDKSDWKSIYKKGMAIGRLSTLANINIDAVINGINRSLEIIYSEKKLSETEIKALKQGFALDLYGLLISINTLIVNHYSEFVELESAIHSMRSHMDFLILGAEYGLSLIDSPAFDDRLKTAYFDLIFSSLRAKTTWRNYVSGYGSIGKEYKRSYLNKTEHDRAIEKFDLYLDKAEADIPGFTTEDIDPVKSGPCYIATAVYGSYDAPEVYILRNYRDNTLMHSRFGRWFVSVYYKISPALAAKLETKSFVNSIIKKILDEWTKHLPY